MKDKVYLYPLWVRVWHLINAIAFLILMVTGLSLQYSSPDLKLIPFNFAVSWHNIAGIVLIVDFAFFIVGNRFTSNGTYYQFKLKGLYTRIMRQFKYYSYGIFKKKRAPYPISIKRKFNPLQKLSYVGVMYFFIPIVIVTGLGLFFPETLPNKILGLSGIHMISLIHMVTGFVLSIFLVAHIYLCTIGKTPLSNFKSMVNGWH